MLKKNLFKYSILTAVILVTSACSPDPDSENDEKQDNSSLVEAFIPGPVQKYNTLKLKAEDAQANGALAMAQSQLALDWAGCLVGDNEKPITSEQELNSALKTEDPNWKGLEWKSDSGKVYKITLRPRATSSYKGYTKLEAIKSW